MKAQQSGLRLVNHLNGVFAREWHGFMRHESSCLLFFVTPFSSLKKRKDSERLSLPAVIQ